MGRALGARRIWRGFFGVVDVAGRVEEAQGGVRRVDEDRRAEDSLALARSDHDADRGDARVHQAVSHEDVALLGGAGDVDVDLAQGLDDGVGGRPVARDRDGHEVRDVGLGVPRKQRDVHHGELLHAAGGHGLAEGHLGLLAEDGGVRLGELAHHCRRFSIYQRWLPSALKCARGDAETAAIVGCHKPSGVVSGPPLDAEGLAVAGGSLL